MQLISDYMIKHHKECDATLTRAGEAAAASDWAALQRDAEAFLREIERHIVIEDTLLFPAFEERTGMGEGGPTATMRTEHEQMHGMFAQMRAAIEARDAKQYVGVSETLLTLLQMHNAKEEEMMYPMLDQTLGDDARDLLAQVESIAA